MTDNLMLLEARRLYDLGFALLWIHPKGKRPIESGWTTGPRTSWQKLKNSYTLGNNLGVRTGTPSRLKAGGYLAVIDVDIKSPEFKAVALAKVKELINGAPCPVVLSGSGNGSRHYYCTTREPFKMLTVLKEEGGEVCIYSDGRQMVVPPSVTVHPYMWIKTGALLDVLPLLDFSGVVTTKKKATSKLSEFEKRVVDMGDFKFEPVQVDMGWLDISDKVREGIIHGTNVRDRSGYLLQASTALFSAGLNTNEVLSVLTDKQNFLGACAYDHARTESRERAAAWLYTYTVQRVASERNGASLFTPASIYGAIPLLTEAEEIAQTSEVLAERNWKQDLTRGGKEGKGALRSTIENVVLILTNDVSHVLVKLDEFAFRDTYGANTPWKSKIGDAITDDDIPQIMFWLGHRWGFEPGKDTVFNALTVIALRNSYDPVKDGLDALPVWDGTPRLDTWLKDHFEAEGSPEYLAQVFRKWIVAMVLRAYYPGTKFDWMPIFEGLQGVGKSSFGRILVGDKYFLDWLPNLADKDSALALQGMWGVEMGELSQFRKNETEVIKGFITRTVDKVRPPFGRRWLEISRRCVFFGSTNKDKYLRDDTGNRRFKPVKVGELDFDQLKLDRDQLFAEAKHLINEKIETPRTLELTSEAKEFEVKLHADKMVVDDASAMKELIQEFMEKELKKPNEKERFPFKKFKAQSLFLGIGPLSKYKFDGRNLQFVAKAIKSLGGSNWKSDGSNYWKITIQGEVLHGAIPQDFY